VDVRLWQRGRALAAAPDSDANATGTAAADSDATTYITRGIAAWRLGVQGGAATVGGLAGVGRSLLSLLRVAAIGRGVQLVQAVTMPYAPLRRTIMPLGRAFGGDLIAVFLVPPFCSFKELTGKSAFWRNAALKASEQSTVVNTKMPGPIGYAHCLAIVGDIVILARIVALFSAGSPSAIVRGVRPVIVNALDRMLRRWPLSHVGEEVVEGRVPSLAHDNPAPAIVRVDMGVGIVASGADASPYLVFGRTGTPMLGAHGTQAFCG
jgi:hypothetical protein